jgi:3-oxoacyl-[acyl-carrier protein] reductase
MRVALVTGASRGLGRQIALALSENGYSVAANYLSSQKQAETLIRAIGNNSAAFKADVGDIGQVRVMAENIRNRFGRLDAIINNAGITKDNLLLRQTESEWDRIISTNLKGCFNVIRTMSPLMIQSGGGSIINISSYSGAKGRAGQPAYSASKAAILGLTRSAAQELAQYHVRVNAVLPGYMETGMGTAARNAAKIAVEESILNKLSVPHEAADFILYLVKTGNISGQIFSLESRVL